MTMTMPSGDDASGEQSTDRELLARLREGDQSAYEQLWSQHVGAALRVARRYDPHRAEDLVSEAFLAVYEQVAVAGKGPESAFRAYLFTVIRNASAKHARLDDLIMNDPEIDTVNSEDGMYFVARAEDAAQLLSTFRALPERWQRVLWLSEVERAPRADIARTLGIRPNAVSALLRRARAGLQDQWLAQRVPARLRNDPAHVARFLSGYVAGTPIDIPKPAVVAHLQRCRACHEVHRELETAHRRMRKVALSAVGFAALGVTLPTSMPVTGTAAALATLTLGATGGAAGIGAILACTGLVTAVVAGIAGGGSLAVPPTPSPTVIAHAPGPRMPPPPQPTPRPVAPVTPVTPVTEDDQPTAGRGNSSPDIPSLDVEFAFDTLVTPRERPPGAVPVIAPTPTPTAGGDVEETGPAVTLDSRPESAVYVAPVLAGTASGADTVFVSVGDALYRAEAGAGGTWSFDAATVPLAVGTHGYEIWATDASGVAGPRVAGEFTLLAVEVAGFEDTADLLLDEASSSGIVFTASGPAGGTLCVDSDSGQSAELPLDDTGKATRRLRFLAGGFYTITFTVCTANALGVPAERSLFVDDPSIIFSPFEPPPPEIEIGEVD